MRRRKENPKIIFGCNFRYIRRAKRTRSNLQGVRIICIQRGYGAARRSRISFFGFSQKRKVKRETERETSVFKYTNANSGSPAFVRVIKAISGKWSGF